MSLDVSLSVPRMATVFTRNITHNLGDMAKAAGIYEHLWRPDEIGITKAHQLIEPLTEGLARLLADPGKFEKLNPENGYGSYYDLCEFVRKYIAACAINPDACVDVSR